MKKGFSLIYKLIFHWQGRKYPQTKDSISLHIMDRLINLGQLCENYSKTFFSVHDVLQKIVTFLAETNSDIFFLVPKKTIKLTKNRSKRIFCVDFFISQKMDEIFPD